MSDASSRAGTLFSTQSNVYPLETARAIAVILLVGYHVIGSESSALQLNYPHPLRYYADFLVDLRMSLFALIAGAVYALRPVILAQLPKFLSGKLRRLAIPGIVAISVYLIANMFISSEFVEPQPLWRYYLWSFLHFWFLQALLVIMFVYCTLDIISNGRVLLPVMLLAFIAASLDITMPSQFMSLDSVVILLPYFLLGITLVRHRDWIMQNRRSVLIVSIICIVIGALWNLKILEQQGHFSMIRNDLQTVLLGAGLCVAAMLTLPTFPALAIIGPYSFSIYLYHIIGTSGARQFLYGLGIDNPWIHFVWGLLIGLALPIVVHLISMQWGLTRRVVLGLKK